MCINNDGQMPFSFDNKMAFAETIVPSYPKMTFNFNELFSTPISEEFMYSHNSMAILGIVFLF